MWRFGINTKLHRWSFSRILTRMIKIISDPYMGCCLSLIKYGTIDDNYLKDTFSRKRSKNGVFRFFFKRKTKTWGKKCFSDLLILFKIQKTENRCYLVHFIAL